MTSSKRQVPELSLLSYANGTSQDQIKFVDDIMFGLKEYGFIVLKDHPLEQKKIDHAYEIVQEFFKLPVETKMKYKLQNGGQRGYTPFKVEHAKDNKHPDLKEFWHVGRDLSSTSKYLGEYPENVWPSEVKNLKEIFQAFYTGMDVTSKILLEAIGKGLDVRPNFFNEMVDDGNSILRMIHYPPTKGEDTNNSIRSAAHGDINLITMLVGATASGLQLLDKDGTWLDVNSKPGEIVVDTGDMMERLTNSVLPSTIHRVINPNNDSSARFSMPFFVHPHSKASLKCLPSCVGAGEKYSEISAGDFLNQRLREIGLY
jgi:isopenicillin N synthase-like dioxygenase